MGKVVAGVAHEIRNPLFGISSVGQILERESTNPAHQELVRALLSETKRMNQLVEELLIYGKPIKLNPEWCDLVSVWEEVITMHRTSSIRSGSALDADLNIGHLNAYLDANQIRQVFLNLLRNSIDATTAGGEITIRMLLEDERIIFKVADTGIGISAEHMKNIFDLFFTTKPKGTGLGLAICRKIVQDHGGDISVESVERKGNGGDREAAVSGNNAGQPGTDMPGILIIDDDNTITAALVYHFTSCGWDAAAAGSGEPGDRPLRRSFLSRHHPAGHEASGPGRLGGAEAMQGAGCTRRPFSS